MTASAGLAEGAPNDAGVLVERRDSGEPARGHRRRIPPPFQVPDYMRVV